MLELVHGQVFGLALDSDEPAGGEASGHRQITRNIGRVIPGAGPRKPQISKLAGVAVCLIENTNGARRGGETPPSNCELVGVETAAPPPPMIAEAANPGSEPSAAAAMPPPSSSNEAWLILSAP
jgi:hypothetical protein